MRWLPAAGAGTAGGMMVAAARHARRSWTRRWPEPPPRGGHRDTAAAITTTSVPRPRPAGGAAARRRRRSRARCARRLCSCSESIAVERIACHARSEAFGKESGAAGANAAAMLLKHRPPGIESQPVHAAARGSTTWTRSRSPCCAGWSPTRSTSSSSGRWPTRSAVTSTPPERRRSCPRRTAATIERLCTALVAEHAGLRADRSAPAPASRPQAVAVKLTPRSSLAASAGCCTSATTTSTWRRPDSRAAGAGTWRARRGLRATRSCCTSPRDSSSPTG